MAIGRWAKLEVNSRNSKLLDIKIIFLASVYPTRALVSSVYLPNGTLLTNAAQNCTLIYVVILTVCN